MKEIRHLWPKVLDELRSRVTPQQFQTWFAHITPAARNAGKQITLRVPTEYHKEWLTKSYKGLIEEVLSHISDEPTGVQFTAEEASPLLRDIDPYCHLNRDYSFESFVVGPSNRLAYAAALAVAESPGKAYNPLFLYGGVGVGKTHLLHAVCLSLLDKSPETRVLYLPCESFVNHFISTVNTRRWDSFRETYRQLDVLAVDDVHFLSRSQCSREEFFHTFNSLYNSQRQILLSSDCPPGEIPALEKRLVSRFQWGLLARIDPPDLETRIAIIEKKAQLQNIRLPMEVMRVIAEKTPGNVRELEGALTQFSRLSSLNPASPSTEIALRVVRELSAKKPSSVGIENILSTVACYFNLSLQQLQSKNRSKTVASARQVAMYLARRLTPLSLQEIGGYLGGRDHSTVVYAEERVNAMRQRDKDFAQLVDDLEKKLLRGG